MQKNKKIVLVLIMAFIVAVVGGVALYYYLTPQKMTVYVFKQTVKAGEVLDESMLMPIQSDVKMYMAGAKTDISTVYATGSNIDTILKSGDTLRMDVVAGMPLTLSMLTANGGSKIEMNMDPTKIAISVPVTNITGVTPDLKSGSRVNVYVTGGIDKDTAGTMLLFQNMRVLSVAKTNDGSLSTATLETTIEESLKLVYYANSASIYLGLVDSSGYAYSAIDEPKYSPMRENNYSDSYAPVIDTPEDTTETTTENTIEEITEQTTTEEGK